MTDLNVNTDIAEGLLQTHSSLLASNVSSKVSKADLKSTHTLKLIGRRWHLDLKRYAYDLKQLDTVLASINKQCAFMRRSAIENSRKYNKPVSEDYLRGIKRQAKLAQRYHRIISKQAESVLTTTKKLFGNLSADELDLKFKQIMRIPQDEFVKFNDMEPQERETRLLELMDQYGQGTKNGDFAAAELNMQGFYHDSHILNTKHEKDGSLRRPQFVHEMISRLIYGCIHPEKSKEIFFLRTTKIVKKWGKKQRQMRAEGRFAMVRTLIVLLPHLDFKRSMRIGYRDRQTGKFSGISRAEIAKRAGISLESVKGAIKALEDQCLIHKGKQPREEVERNGVPGYKGLAVVRCVSANLIVRLGLGERWNNDERKINKQGHGSMPDDEKALRDELKYAEMHPEQFTNQEIAAIEIKIALL